MDRLLAGDVKETGQSGNWLHFCRFLAHPIRVRSIMPASETLSRLIGTLCREGGGVVVELGAGTGVITRAILAAGVPTDKLIAIELDKGMAKFLRATAPGISVVEDDAFDLGRILPPQVRGKVSTVVCGLSVALLPFERQSQLVSAAFSLMPKSGRLLVFSYWLTSPLPAAQLGLVCEKRLFTLRNFPPASVWIFRRADAAEQSSGRAA